VSSRRFDLMFAGLGPAAYALLDALERRGLGGLRVALIDREATRGNDRTWCFWERDAGPFETLVSHSWSALEVHPPLSSEAKGRRLPLSSYRYKMIRAGDFFAAMERRFPASETRTRFVAEVDEVTEDPGGATVRIGQELLSAPFLFDSTAAPTAAPKGYDFLLQHFKGLDLCTESPAFDPDVATFMDFRVAQQGGTCFVYVLPTSETEALVEFTVFSKELWPRDAYDAPLEQYLHEVLGVTDYRVSREEYGVIPMSDLRVAGHSGTRIIRLGSAGGRTKGSTGFTFTRVVRHAEALAAAYAATGEPRAAEPSRLFRYLDGVMLRSLASGRVAGATFFSQLLARNPIERVLAFLDDDTTAAETLALMGTVDVPRFSVSALEVAGRRLAARIGER